MQKPDVYIRQYIDTVCEQIKAKKVHSNVSKEITCHIEEQKDAYLREGIDEENAAKKAIAEMGDPVSVGNQLNKLHRPVSEKYIISLTLLLVAAGLLIQFLINDGNSSLSRLLIYTLIGIAALMATYFIDYSFIGKYPKHIFGFFAITCIILHFIIERLGNAGLYSYYLSLLFIPVLSGVLYGFRGYGYIGIIASGLFYVLLGFLFLSSNSTYAFLLISCAFFILITITIYKRWYSVKRAVALTIAYSPVLAGIVYMSLSGKLSRILSLRQSGINSSYISVRIMEMIESSKFIGRCAPVDSNIIPNTGTDYTLTYIISVYGMAVGIAAIILVSLLIYRMFCASFRQRTSLGFIVSFSATLAFSLQALCFVAVNFGYNFIPSNTMPFLSNNGFGIVINMILIGLILSAFRNINLVFEKSIIYKKKNLRTIFRSNQEKENLK